MLLLELLLSVAAIVLTALCVAWRCEVNAGRG